MSIVVVVYFAQHMYFIAAQYRVWTARMVGSVEVRPFAYWNAFVRVVSYCFSQQDKGFSQCKSRLMPCTPSSHHTTPPALSLLVSTISILTLRLLCLWALWISGMEILKIIQRVSSLIFLPYLWNYGILQLGSISKVSVPLVLLIP